MKKLKIKEVLQKGVVGLSAVMLLGSSGAVFAHNNDNGRFARNGQSSQSHKYQDDQRRRKDDRWGKTCEQRQEDVDTAVATFKERATSKYNKVSVFYSAQKEYVASSNLQVEQYQSLVDRADRAGVRAAQRIGDLTAPDIDCNQSRRQDGRLLRAAIKPVQGPLQKYTDRVGKVANAIWQEVR